MNKSDDKSIQTQDSIESQVNQSLDQSIENLNPEIRRRLNQIKADATQKKSNRFILVPIASALSLALALFVAWTYTQSPPSEETLFAEVLEEEFELLEDLELIYWMNEESQSANL